MDTEALLADLDERQRAAVVTLLRSFAVIAAAGSGKTRVLTRRIAYRIADGTADARHTLALTFTREAAGELRRRLRRLGLRDHVEAGTFHSVALGVLQQRWADTDRRAPTIVAHRERLIGELVEPSAVADVAAERTWAAAAASRPMRTSLRPGRRTADALFGSAHRRSPRRLRDAETPPRRDRSRRPPAPARPRATRDAGFADGLRWRFRHVLVDEAQDLNPVQHQLLRQLAGERRDLFLVGDPAQAIFGFNGSDPTLLADVDRHLAGVEVIRLPTNYRCTPQIVAAGRHALGGVGYHDDAAVVARPTARRWWSPPPTTSTPKRPWWHASFATSVAAPGPAVESPCWQDASAARPPRPGPRRRRRAGATRMARAGEPARAAVRAAGLLSSAAQLRGWAHDRSRPRRRRTTPSTRRRSPNDALRPPCSSSCATGPRQRCGAARLARLHQPVHRRHRGGRRGAV